MELLLEHNADIEARDKDNKTPLHHAASGNSGGLVELLVKYNTNIEARDESNEMPLFHSVKSDCSAQVTTQLPEYNAEIEASDK